MRKKLGDIRRGRALSFHIPMLGFMKSAPAARPDHAACCGCSLCLLVCPVWRSTRDLRLTPHGRAKALQQGAGISDIAASVESCTLCAACEPVCPEEIDLVGMIMDLRRRLPHPAALQTLQRRIDEAATRPAAARPGSHSALLPDRTLRDRVATLTRTQALLASSVSADDGEDIALGLETGAVVPAQRVELFLAPLRRLAEIIVADGLLLRHLKSWLPKSKIVSLGEALSRLAIVRDRLRATDLYVIEPRAYHADYQRLVKYYDRLRVATGCAMNLDLQRIAIPATARSLPQRLGLTAPDDSGQVRWILQGRKITRIVVENVEDVAAFVPLSHCRVVYLADLADDG